MHASARPNRLPSHLEVVTGLLAAACLLGLTPLTSLSQVHTSQLNALGGLFLALIGLTLVVRRLLPEVGFVVGVGSAVAYIGLNFPGWPVYIGAVLSVIALLTNRGRAGIPLAIGGGAAVAIAVGLPEDWQWPRMLTVFVVWLAIVSFTAEATESRRRHADEMARHRVVEERLRIARELHDVLSHTLATISIQSGVGLRLYRTRPNEAETSLRLIRQVSNKALEQARTVLAKIRDPEPTNGRPSPGFGDLDALFESARASGLMLKVSVVQGMNPQRPEIEATVYRIVQESLTNVLRHAGGAAEASVDIVCTPEWVAIDILDTGRAARRDIRNPGYGVVGMRERVHELGGEFRAAAEPSGGFHVSARLPAEGSAS